MDDLNSQSQSADCDHQEMTGGAESREEKTCVDVTRKEEQKDFSLPTATSNEFAKEMEAKIKFSCEGAMCAENDQSMCPEPEDTNQCFGSIPPNQSCFGYDSCDECRDYYTQEDDDLEMEGKCVDIAMKTNFQERKAMQIDVSYQPKLADDDQENSKSNESLSHSPVSGLGHNATSNYEDNSGCKGGLRLDQLDDDSLFHIASFLEARVIQFGLSQVCQRFQAMFDNETYWRTRIALRWPKKYPAVTPPSDFTWVDACVEREDSHRIWNDPLANTNHFSYDSNLYGEVDVVHVMKNGQLLVSGDRNRILNVIDLTKYKSEGGTEVSKECKKDMLVFSDYAKHKGWIWSMASVDNHLLTGSWDAHIRVFDVNSEMKQLADYKCKSAVLSLYAEENDIVASSFDKKIYFIDRRTSKYTSHIFHKQAVLCVTGNEHFYVSGSEDKTIAVFDRRANKLFKTLKLDTYPLSMSYNENQLWFGDKAGQVHLCDASDGAFELVGTYDVGHKDKITGIINTRSTLFTCSGDKSLKVHAATREPDLITSLNVHRKEIAKIAYDNGVLASAGGDDCLGVWLPKHWDKSTYLL